MNKPTVSQRAMLRKTKLQLINMLEEQRLIIRKANENNTKHEHLVIRKQSMINTLQNEASQAGAKYEHLCTNHESMLRDNCRKEIEFEQLNNAYMDALELNVRLLLEKE